jgi:hypothetical protein
MSALAALLTDGPCIGSYDVQRAPVAMRATVKLADGTRYVLDLVDDVVEPGEVAHLYRRDGGIGFACGRRARDSYRTVTYTWVGLLDPATGVVADPSPRDREWWDGQRALALSAWALGEPYTPLDPMRPVAEPAQLVLL